MRILHLIPSLGGGGAERQLVLMSRDLSRRGHDLHVGVVYQGPHVAQLASSATLHMLPSRGNHDPALLLRLRSLIRRLQPDIVQTWLTQMDVLGGAAARWTGTPWILTERCCADAYAPSLKNWLRLRLGRYSDAIVSNSRGGDAFWRDRIGFRGFREVIPNGVDSEEIAQLSSSCAPPFTGASVLFAGRLEEQKNVAGFLDALELLIPRARPPVLLCGAGPDRPAIETRIRNGPLSGQVHVLGYREDLPLLMKEAAVFVSTSWFEGHPNTVLEAMTCGCPLIVSRIPAHEEFVDETCALLVDPGNLPEIADALAAVLTDRGSALQRAAVARERVSAFSATAAAVAYEKVYERVLGNRRHIRNVNAS